MKERDHMLEEYYQDHNELSTGMQRNFVEKRMNERNYGVIGEALLKLLMIVVLGGIIFLVVFLTK